MLSEQVMSARRLISVLVLCAAVAACSARDTEVTAVQRGDQAFAENNFDEAVAEYRRAIRQGADDPAVTARVAHSYASPPVIAPSRPS